MTEGYVGVTGRSLVIRCNQHTRLAQEKEQNLTLHNAIRKHGKLLKVDLLFVGTQQECFEMEAQYRPSPNIGWNICEGGFGLDKETQKSFWRRPEYKAAHIARIKSAWQDEDFRKRNLPNLQKGVEVIKKKLSKKPWSASKASRTRREVWPFAQDYYETWKECGECGHQRLSSVLQVSPDGLRRIVKMFKEGWVPKEDPLWKEDFRGGVYVGSESSHDTKPLSEESKAKIRESVLSSGKQGRAWSSVLSDESVWVNAENIYNDYIADPCGDKKLAQRNGYSDSKLRTMHDMFRAGWIPKEDKTWVEWRREKDGTRHNIEGARGSTDRVPFNKS